jgi:hypothetical protein
MSNPMSQEEIVKHFGPVVVDPQADTRTFERNKRRKALKMAIYEETALFMDRIAVLRAEMEKWLP